MSKLDELIKELCPNGCEYRALEECCTILDRKRKPVTKAARVAGQYPYYGANGIQDYVADYIFDGTFVLVGEDGSVITPSGTPVVTWATGKIWVNNHAHIIEEKGDVLLRYLYHYLQIVDVTPLIHGNIPKLTGGDFKALQIPVPPLAVQEEIVRILDNFTSLTAELTAELTARKKQYEYYRDELLTFGSDAQCGTALRECGMSGRSAPNCNNVTWKTLGELFPNIRNGFVGTITPYFTTKDKGVRYLEGTNIHNGIISDNEVLYVTQEFHQKHIKNELKSDDILMVQSGHIGECAVVGEKYKGANCHALIIMSNGGKCNSKFYCHYFHSHEGYKSLTPAMTGGTVKHVLATKMKNIKVPVPPIEIQNKIVSILDRFDSLCNDISEGLPAEIEARQKQYEYYRDALLNYAAKGVAAL